MLLAVQQTSLGSIRLTDGATGDDVRLAQALVAELHLNESVVPISNWACDIRGWYYQHAHFVSHPTAYPFYCEVTGALPGTSQAQRRSRERRQTLRRVVLSIPLSCSAAIWSQQGWMNSTMNQPPHQVRAMQAANKSVTFCGHRYKIALQVSIREKSDYRDLSTTAAVDEQSDRSSPTLQTKECNEVDCARPRTLRGDQGIQFNNIPVGKGDSSATCCGPAMWYGGTALG